VAQEFYPLLAFMKETAAAIGHTQIAKAIEGASASGVALAPKFMGEDYKNLLDDLQRIAGAGGSELTRTAAGGWDSTREFVVDIVNFMREWPAYAAGFTVLAGALYLMNDNSA